MSPSTQCRYYLRSLVTSGMSLRVNLEFDAIWNNIMAHRLYLIFLLKNISWCSVTIHLLDYDITDIFGKVGILLWCWYSCHDVIGIHFQRMACIPLSIHESYLYPLYPGFFDFMDFMNTCSTTRLDANPAQYLSDFLMKKYPHSTRRLYNGWFECLRLEISCKNKCADLA